MADETIGLKVTIPRDKRSATLLLEKQNGEELAHVTFTIPQLRQTVVDLVRILAHLERDAVPPPSPKPGQEVNLPLPTALPAWRIGGLDTGEPVIAVELYENLWVSFSLSIADGNKLASALRRRLAPQKRRPKQ